VGGLEYDTEKAWRLNHQKLLKCSGGFTWFNQDDSWDCTIMIHDHHDSWEFSSITEIVSEKATTKISAKHQNRWDFWIFIALTKW